jgi:hypothetical protein
VVVVKQRPWYPVASGAGWGLLVLALVLVNSGNVVLALLVGLAVGLLSWRLAVAQRSPEQ